MVGSFLVVYRVEGEDGREKFDVNCVVGFWCLGGGGGGYCRYLL